MSQSETKQERLIRLQKLGAGDEQCVECLSLGVHDFEVCQRCIAVTPEFTVLMNRFLEHSGQVKR